MKITLARFALATALVVTGLTGTTAPSLAQIERLQNEASQNRSSYIPPADRSGPRVDRSERPRHVNSHRADRGRGEWRRDRDRREWRRDRHHRDYRRDRRHRDRYWRRDRGPSVYFEYGPSYRYVEPRYVAPRYVAPRYVRPSVRLSAAHVRWCHARYRSYRSSDNSFQPYNGPRRQCYSPYS